MELLTHKQTPGLEKACEQQSAAFPLAGASPLATQHFQGPFMYWVQVAFGSQHRSPGAQLVLVGMHAPQSPCTTFNAQHALGPPGSADAPSGTQQTWAWLTFSAQLAVSSQHLWPTVQPVPSITQVPPAGTQTLPCRIWEQQS